MTGLSPLVAQVETRNRKLTVLDLFSGIGGFSLGLERTGGFETVAFCEIEDFPRRVLAKHWPKVPCYHDIRELTAERLAADGIAVDVICGGFPCQDLSSAGKQGGISAGRSGLWSEMVRLVGEIRPQFAIIENVTNLLAGERGAWFATVLSDLAALRYDAEWHCIEAANVGLPQGRDRVWILAYADGQRRGCLVKSQQVQSAAINFTDFEGWPPDTLRVLPNVARLVANTDGIIERNDNGLSEGMGQLKGYGNAVVPQVVTVIGNAILASMGRS
jgi:DNA (cytosine-5)-methyltransferase 1